MTWTRTLLIARAELRRRFRNRSAVITAVIAPLALAVVFSSLIGGAGGSDIRIGVLDLDGGAVSSAVVRSLLESNDDGPVDFVEMDDDDAAKSALEGVDVGAVIVFEPGFTTSSGNTNGSLLGEGSGAPGMIEVRRTPEAAITGQIAQSVADSIAAEFNRRSLTSKLAVDGGVSPPGADGVSAAITFADVAVGGREVDAGAFFGASMSILFLFFTVGFGSRSIHAERRQGTLTRLLATPATPAEILAGKSAAVSLLALWGFMTVWGATTLIFDAPWGAPGAVVALIVATVLAISGIAAFIGSLAKNERQADTATSVTAFAFALLGGNFVSPGAAPALLRQLSSFTPNGWALRAFTSLNADAASISDIGTTLAVLLGFAVIFGGIGLTRAARSMIP